MILVSQKTDVLNDWGRAILEKPDVLRHAVLKSKLENTWFDTDSQWKAIEAIAVKYLLSENLSEWIRSYPLHAEPKKIGIVMAGNLPLVGFHDLLSVLVSGHFAKIKLSGKDKYLLPALLKILEGVAPQQAQRVEFVEGLKDIDAFIATGSDSSANYFLEYFGQYSHIIRKNRSSLAVLKGDESDDELRGLARDICDYYGLGCRSVSLLFCPGKESRHRLFNFLSEDASLIDNQRYNNNYRYNYAISVMNQEEFETNNIILMKRSSELHSRIACLHYEYYNDLKMIEEFYEKHREEIQCLVAQEGLFENISTVAPGKAQLPGLFDYADNVDTREFLANL